MKRLITITAAAIAVALTLTACVRDYPSQSSRSSRFFTKEDIFLPPDTEYIYGDIVWYTGDNVKHYYNAIIGNTAEHPQAEELFSPGIKDGRTITFITETYGTVTISGGSWTIMNIRAGD